MRIDNTLNLDRFVTAQARTYSRALAELVAGEKRGHWMWFVFPQIAGLGQSDTARFYAIRSIPEARAYLMHPLLGPRLNESVNALMGHPERSAKQMLGAIDAMKLRSSLTLFLAAGASAPVEAALQTFFGSTGDPETLARLATADV